MGLIVVINTKKMLCIKYALLSATEEQVREAVFLICNVDIVDSIKTITHVDVPYKSFMIKLIPGKRTAELVQFVRDKGSHAIYHGHYWYLTV